MLSAQDWWIVISNYNQSIFPLQLIIMLAALVLTLYLFRKPGEKVNIAIKIFLSICNLWIGIMFFIVFGNGFPSPMKYFQSFLFVMIGLLFAIDIFTKKTSFTIPPKGFTRTTTIVFLIITFLYPVFGMLFGRSQFQLICPGTLPCPTTAFALALLSASLPNVNKVVYTLLLIWAIPFPPMIQIPMYKVYEDSIMLMVGLYALVMLLRYSFSLVRRKADPFDK